MTDAVSGTDAAARVPASASAAASGAITAEAALKAILAAIGSAGTATPSSTSGLMAEGLADAKTVGAGIASAVSAAIERLASWSRGGLIALTAGVLVYFVGIFAHQQLGVMLYKAAVIASAGYGAYWVDRALAYYARPHRFLPADPTTITLPAAIAFGAASLRRAIVVAAVVVGAAVAL